MRDVEKAGGHMRGRLLRRAWVMVLVVTAVGCGLLAMHALGALGHHGAGSAVSSHAAADTTAVMAPHTTTLVAPQIASPESHGGGGVHTGVNDTSGNVLQVRGCTDGCEVGSVAAICLAVLGGLYLLARRAGPPRFVVKDPAGRWRPLLPAHSPRGFASGPQLLNLLCVSRT